MKTMTAHHLSHQERDSLIADLARDGFATLPFKLSGDLHEATIDAIDRQASIARQKPGSQKSVMQADCVLMDPAFTDLVLYKPALQLAFDMFSGLFQLNQSNFISRPQDEVTGNFIGSAPWHTDGPSSGKFPRVHGGYGLHYLKFGYFLTDLTHGSGGSLEVLRGSHLHADLDYKDGQLDMEKYHADHVKLDVEPGTIVMFNQATWHAAPPNLSPIERKNLYISYCPLWMRPYDHSHYDSAQIAHLDVADQWILNPTYDDPTHYWKPSSAHMDAIAEKYGRSE